MTLGSGKGVYSPQIQAIGDQSVELKRKNHSWKPEKKHALEQFGYELGETIGEGQYSKIKSAHIKSKNIDVAVKIILKTKIPKETYEKYLRREVFLMQSIQYEHVIAIYDVYESKNYLYIAMELAKNGDLLKHVNETGHLSENQSKRLFLQMVKAVKVLHDAGVAHRDIELENFLLDEKWNIKLADFGFAILQTEGQFCETFCGSYAYTAPEVLDGDPYDGREADIWGLGVCLYGMLHGRLPFHEEDADVLRQSLNEPVEMNSDLSSECCHLMCSMLNVDPKSRIKMADILTSAWLHEPHWVCPREDPDLDSSWSVLSFEDLSVDCVANQQDPLKEHGYNNDQHHAEEAASTVVSDVLTAVLLNSIEGKGPTSSVTVSASKGKGRRASGVVPRPNTTNIGVIGAAGRRLSVGLGLGPNPDPSVLDTAEETLTLEEEGKQRGGLANYRRRSVMAGGQKRFSIAGHRPNLPLGVQTPRRMSMPVPGQRRMSLGLGHVVEEGGPAKDKEGEEPRNDTIESLKYSAGGKVAQYLSKSRKSISHAAKRKSLQKMVLPEEETKSTYPAVTNETLEKFKSKLLVLNSH